MGHCVLELEDKSLESSEFRIDLLYTPLGSKCCENGSKIDILLSTYNRRRATENSQRVQMPRTGIIPLPIGNDTLADLELEVLVLCDDSS